MKTNRNTLLWRMIRKRGLYHYQVMNKMQVTRPTLNKYIDSPDVMSGHYRKKLAYILGVEIETIDSIANKKIQPDAEAHQRILDSIEPIQIRRYHHEDAD